jgi:hypothetical protein
LHHWQAVRLLLSGGQAASEEARLEPLAYEFFEQVRVKVGLLINFTGLIKVPVLQQKQQQQKQKQQA